MKSKIYRARNLLVGSFCYQSVLINRFFKGMFWLTVFFLGMFWLVLFLKECSDWSFVWRIILILHFIGASWSVIFVKRGVLIVHFLKGIVLIGRLFFNVLIVHFFLMNVLIVRFFTRGVFWLAQLLRKGVLIGVSFQEAFWLVGSIWMACEVIQGGITFGSLSIVHRVVVSDRSKPASCGVRFFCSLGAVGCRSIVSVRLLFACLRMCLIYMRGFQLWRLYQLFVVQSVLKYECTYSRDVGAIGLLFIVPIFLVHWGCRMTSAICTSTVSNWGVNGDLSLNPFRTSVPFWDRPL